SVHARSIHSPPRTRDHPTRISDCDSRIADRRAAIIPLPIADRSFPHPEVALPPNIAETTVPVRGRRCQHLASLFKDLSSGPCLPLPDQGRDRIVSPWPT